MLIMTRSITQGPLQLAQIFVSDEVLFLLISAKGHADTLDGVDALPGAFIEGATLLIEGATLFIEGATPLEILDLSSSVELPELLPRMRLSPR